MITVGYSTRKHNQEFIDYLKKTCGLNNIQIIEKVNNGEKSLSKTYNEIINESDNNYILLCHDDVLFDTKNWGKKLIKHLDKKTHHILGVAGTTNLSESGRWWDDRAKMVGIVNHLHEGKKWESKYSKSYGNDIIDVCLVDGLFICINKEKIKSFFDESVEGFHFYDVQFCINNFTKKTPIGVIFDIRITHKSIGVTNDSWESNRLKFVEKNSNNLPINLEPKINYDVFKNKKIKTKINLILQTGDNLEKTKFFIKKIKTFDLIDFKINLISNSNNLNEILSLKEDNIFVFEGFFNELNKNLSVLKWDESLVSKKDELIFLFNSPIDLKNNIFYSVSEVYSKEKNKFGSCFPISLNKNYTVFSSDLNFFLDKNNKVQINIKNFGSYYNILDGYKNSLFGSLSEVIVTTPRILEKLDWLEVRHNSPLFFNFFAAKCIKENLTVFVDTNSICEQDYFDLNKDSEIIQTDFNDLVNFITSEKKLKDKLKVLQ